MHSPSVAKTTNADSSARMLASTVTTLACAFLLILAAALTVVLTIAHEANTVEAQRQRDRIEAAMENQVRLRRLRLESMASGGALQAALHPMVPASSLRWAFARLSPRFIEFDGAYLVTGAGRVVAGVEHQAEAGQVGYDGLRLLAPGLPGEPGPKRDAAEPVQTGTPEFQFSLIYDGHEVIGVLAADLARVLKIDMPRPDGPIFLIGYRRVTHTLLDEMASRYRINGLRIAFEKPSNPLVRRDITSPDGVTKGWLTWTPERPGDAMIRQFIWALAGAGLIFAAILLFAIRRLRSAANEIRMREVQIQRLAAQDELSLLPNRRTFDLRLDQELAQLQRTKNGLAVMLLDLDRFKTVNDTYGHKAGDDLIRQVAARLAGVMRTGDTVARLGGDEFGVIQTNLQDAAGAAALGERILAALTQPFALQGIDTVIGCSIGIALAPQDGADRETLFKLADAALYQSKNEGRNRFTFFEQRMNRALQMKRLVEEDLRSAIAKNELQLHFQPQVSADGGMITGVEALIRWPHPVHGLVPPQEFVTVAEERGLIVPLSEWVLRNACLEAKRWPHLRLAVNVSPVQFRHKDFVRNTIRIIEETGFDPSRLELELTEGVVVEDADAAETALMDLRAYGIGLALDDFGIGYSSLIYLRRFAFDKIKIDRSFLEYMETTGESAILVHSIVHLGRALGLRVCAEGVETSEQHHFLQAIGCHELQGYLFSKAVPPRDIDKLLARAAPFADTLAA